MRQIYSTHEHQLRAHHIPQHARHVTETLQNAGFEAYVVGGGVRDQLLGLHPKDFDIATNAKPEEIKALFSNCILIGKRFRLAHIHFKRDIIEVATFRASHEQAAEHDASSRDGIIIRDNVYGNLEEDALRRDFTINALYFNPANETIIDYSGGMKDIAAKHIRLIGDPKTRYQEDPIRILRAIRFANKLNFTIDAETEKPIHEMVSLLAKMPAGRLFDEYTKLFLHGHSTSNFNSLVAYDALRYLFPESIVHMQDAVFLKFVHAALYNTDLRFMENKGINPAFLIAVFLWPALKAKLHEPVPGVNSSMEALHFHMAMIMSQQIRHTAMPKKFSGAVKEIWFLQKPLENRKPKQIERLLSHPRFRAAYDFLILRTSVGELDAKIGQWWTEIQLLDNEQRQVKIKSLRSKK